MPCNKTENGLINEPLFVCKTHVLLQIIDHLMTN